MTSSSDGLKVGGSVGAIVDDLTILTRHSNPTLREAALRALEVIRRALQRARRRARREVDRRDDDVYDDDDDWGGAPPLIARRCRHGRGARRGAAIAAAEQHRRRRSPNRDTPTPRCTRTGQMASRFHPATRCVPGSATGWKVAVRCLWGTAWRARPSADPRAEAAPAGDDLGDRRRRRGGDRRARRDAILPPQGVSSFRAPGSRSDRSTSPSVPRPGRRSACGRMTSSTC